MIVLILPKISGYVKTFKVKDKKSKAEAVRKSIKPFGLRLKIQKNIELNALPVYDRRYTETKRRTYGDNVCTNFCGLNVREDDIEFESFTVISIDSLLVYENKYYLQVYR